MLSHGHSIRDRNRCTSRIHHKLDENRIGSAAALVARFGCECMEQRWGIARLKSDEQRWMSNGPAQSRRIMLLCGGSDHQRHRSSPCHRRLSVKGGRCCPGMLCHRLHQQTPDRPTSPADVNCRGETKTETFNPLHRTALTNQASLKSFPARLA